MMRNIGGQAQTRERQLTLNLNLVDKASNNLRDPAFSENKNLPVHRWVPWIAGFSSYFVEDCIDTFIDKKTKHVSRVIDPFAGAGTTLTVAMLKGLNTIGFEINPYAALACRVKLNTFRINLRVLQEYIEEYQVFTKDPSLQRADSTPPGFKSRIPFFSGAILKKVNSFMGFVKRIQNPEIADIFRLAFGSVMISFSNYTYEPSLSSRPGAGKRLIENASVHSIILVKLREVLSDIEWLQANFKNSQHENYDWQIIEGDFMNSNSSLPLNSVDLMVTSPPYMNNYHYVRNTRPQLFWLSLVSSTSQLKSLEEANVGKYWQTVRGRESVPLNFQNKRLQEILTMLRNTRRDKGVYGGAGWANYVATYFNDCRRFLITARRCLRRKAKGVIVIGNSIIQGHEVKTESILAEIASEVGFEVLGLECLRAKRVGASITRSTVRYGRSNKAQLSESALIIRKP